MNTENRELEKREPEDRSWLPFFPHYLLDEVIAWYAMLGVIVVLASLFPAGLEEQANPLQTPAHIKPEWYFLAVYQELKLVPRTIGVLTPMIGVLILILLPFMDRSPHKQWRRRPLAVGLALIVLVATVILSIWGWVS